MFKAIKRQLPFTIAEWLVGIYLLMATLFVGTIFIAIMKLMWEYIL